MCTPHTLTSPARAFAADAVPHRVYIPITASVRVRIVYVFCVPIG